MERHQEIWAKALWVENNKGPDAPRFIADQIARLASDPDGVARCQQIASVCEQLREGSQQ
ncbi:DUF6961 family protein [Novosphingobium tardum]|uniref:DUF6961 family protein n=1 Tax=Novosphingobium tardum TaxID=1538021 RepID=A0ABV8RW06_9SPHN